MATVEMMGVTAGGVVVGGGTVVVEGGGIVVVVAGAGPLATSRLAVALSTESKYSNRTWCTPELTTWATASYCSA